MTSSVWVLTYEANDYNQHGEYFKDVFGYMPSAEDLEKKSSMTDSCAKDLVDKGFHVEIGGDTWYLREEELK